MTRPLFVCAGARVADLEITQRAAEPKKVRVDDTSAEQHSLKDQIEAEQYASKREAAARTGLPLRMALFRPPGAS